MSGNTAAIVPGLIDTRLTSGTGQGSIPAYLYHVVPKRFMMFSGQPADCTNRSDILRTYDILDSLSEQEYDHITHLASAVCQTPISLISLLDDDRPWFKSNHGLALRETPREFAFCTHTIQNADEILIVPDSRANSRFARNPLVVGDPHIIFYAGVPLINPDGYALGSLCVIDNRPRPGLTDDQQATLKILATQIVAMLEMRRTRNALHVQKRVLEQRNQELDQLISLVQETIQPRIGQVADVLQRVKAQNGLSASAIELLDEAAATLVVIDQGLQQLDA